MDTLLTGDFLTHYALTAPLAVAPTKETQATYFELNDDTTLIYLNSGDGVAPHKNDAAHKIKVVNYEAFHTKLPHIFRQGKKICDLIVYTSEVKNYFSLNELTDTVPALVEPFTNSHGVAFDGKRTKAMEQLRNTLALISSVPTIKAFIDTFSTKRCCFFNKQTIPVLGVTPVAITATASFGRVNTLTAEGFQMSNPAIEALGFELFEYSGGQAAVIN